MAYYCINEEKSKNCKYLFKGVVIGTNKKLCNIFSKNKPCQSEDEDIEIKKNE